jgi:hypothetical protein
MSEQPDPYGWDAWVAQTDHRIVAKMIRDKCDEITRLRGVCAESAKKLEEHTINMKPGGRMKAHMEAVITDLENEGKKP